MSTLATIDVTDPHLSERPVCMTSLDKERIKPELCKLSHHLEEPLSTISYPHSLFYPLTGKKKVSPFRAKRLSLLYNILQFLPLSIGRVADLYTV